MPKAIAKKSSSTDLTHKRDMKGLVSAVKQRYPQATEEQIAEYVSEIIQWIGGKLSDGWQMAAIRNVEEGKLDLVFLSLEEKTNLRATPLPASQRQKSFKG